MCWKLICALLPISWKRFRGEACVVVRKPPDRLVVGLVERQRFAWVVLDQTYGIDDEGVHCLQIAWPKRSRRWIYPLFRVCACRGFTFVGIWHWSIPGVLDDVLTWWKQATDVDQNFMGLSQLEALSDGWSQTRRRRIDASA